MNILYLANPNSIHDNKCISYFAGIQGNRIFVVCEQENYGKIPESILSDYQRLNITLAGNFSPFSFKYFWKTISSVFFLRRLIKKHRIELIHVLYTAPDALWILFLSDTKTILTTRGSDILHIIPEIFNQNKGLNIKNKLLSSLFKLVFKKANDITCTSRLQKENIFTFFKRESHVIRTGIKISEIEKKNFDSFLLKEVKGLTYILFPRFMHPVYNHELEIDAISLLDSSVKKKYHFVFIKGNDCDAPYTTHMQNKLVKLKQVNWIFLSHLTPDESLALIQHSSLVVMVPLRDGTPNSALEAMIMKKPLILGNFAYDEDIFKDSCFRMNGSSPDELAGLITNALENYPENLFETGYQRVLQFGNWEKEMGKMREIYRKNW